MDDVEKSIVTNSTEISPKIAEQLERAKKYLFDEDYVPEYLRDSDTFDSRTGKLKLRERAMLAFNNLTVLLPGTWGDGKPKDLKTLSNQQLLSDFMAAARELGVDMEKVEQLNHSEIHSRFQEDGKDSVLELYQYIYPVMEKLALEKGYEVYW